MSFKSNVMRGIQNPEKVPRYLAFRVPYLLYSYYQRRLRGNDGIAVIEEDWDNLIILDACRYDTYTEFVDLPGEYEPVISKGGTTTEFLNKNFTEDEYYDTVYVTANPHVDEHLEGKVHELVSPWRTHWDDTHHTVMPDTMAKITAETAKKFPKKRLISHFIQPHRPFIGPKGKMLETGSGIEGHRQVALGEEPDWRGENPFNRAKRGEIEESTIREAYEENLEIVLDSLEPLLAELEGRTVITADHGNMLSDRFPPLPEQSYPHPGGIYLNPLVEVPWHIINPNETRPIVAESPQLDTFDSNKADDNIIKDRLNDLGYV
jgi:hypothetical protein